jgi:hypothetical protein
VGQYQANVLKAVKRGPSGKRDHPDSNERRDEPQDQSSHLDRCLTSPWRRTRDSRSSLPRGFRAQRTKNRPDSLVGRLHYSLSSTLSAHFRWNVRARASLLCFLVPEYYEVPGTIGTGDCTGQYVN